jgi:hypothetical protein
MIIDADQRQENKSGEMLKFFFMQT